MAAHGAAKVSAYVTHGVFPKQSWERFTHKNGESRHNVPSFCIPTFYISDCAGYTLFTEGVGSAFAYFWITDSCPLTVKAIANKAPFEVLSLAGSIANALQI